MSEKWVAVYTPCASEPEGVYGIFPSREAAEEWARDEYGYYALFESVFIFRVRKAVVDEWA